MSPALRTKPPKGDSTPRPIASDAFPLVLQAAFLHPDASTRTRIRDWVTGWIDTLEPRFSEKRIRRVLEEQRGTVVEPFTLTPRDLEIAVLAVRSAFSTRVRLKRFRIVSSETIGLDGGFILTSKLRGYYIERAAWAARTRTSWRTSFVAPAALPDSIEPLMAVRRARFQLVKAGWSIDVPAAWWDSDHPAALADSLRAAIVDGDRTRILSERDFAISVHRADVRLQTTGPESLIRFTALSEQGALLALSSGLKTSVRRVVLQLAPLEAERGTVRACLTQTSRSTRQWAGFWCDVDVPLPDAEREAIARAFPMHDSWLSPTLLERLS